MAQYMDVIEYMRSLHRTNVLVSTDAGMAQEIQQSGYSASNIHYTRSHHKIRNSGAHVLPKDIHGYSSGPGCLSISGTERSQLFVPNRYGFERCKQ